MIIDYNFLRMVDHLSLEKRSWNMSRIRSKNTKPELIVRKVLHNSGIRYRLHASDLPGKPDLSNKKKKFAVFVNGCFWHQHRGCKRANIPKSNTDYWIPKLKKNVNRFKENLDMLDTMEYRTAVIWECEVNDLKNNKALMEIASAAK
jgi:DNA mismatch endonuclease (patch repair protein)|tara:strand:+ start:78 stop:518 length:441 start_codon:yes stop_codon:yes gene_type:complete